MIHTSQSARERFYSVFVCVVQRVELTARTTRGSGMSQRAKHVCHAVLGRRVGSHQHPLQQALCRGMRARERYPLRRHFSFPPTEHLDGVVVQPPSLPSSCMLPLEGKGQRHRTQCTHEYLDRRWIMSRYMCTRTSCGGASPAASVCVARVSTCCRHASNAPMDGACAIPSSCFKRDALSSLCIHMAVVKTRSYVGESLLSTAAAACASGTTAPPCFRSCPASVVSSSAVTEPGLERIAGCNDA